MVSFTNWGLEKDPLMRLGSRSVSFQFISWEQILSQNNVVNRNGVPKLKLGTKYWIIIMKSTFYPQDYVCHIHTWQTQWFHSSNTFIGMARELRHTSKRENLLRVLRKKDMGKIRRYWSFLHKFSSFQR